MGFSKKSTDTRAADSAPASAPAPDEPSAPSGLSFFSRFTLPLRSRARNIVDFHVRPAEPHRKYGAGDQVQGAVILTVVKPLRITHLVVSLYGYMCVHKGPNVPASESVIDPAELPSVPTRSSRQKSPGSSYVKLFHDEQPLSGEGRLEPGRYEFNFNLLFPADGLPSSIDVRDVPPPRPPSSPLLTPRPATVRAWHDIVHDLGNPDPPGVHRDQDSAQDDRGPQDIPSREG